MPKSYRLTLTKKQCEAVVHELEMGVIGDNDPYDSTLKRIITKIKGQIEEQDDK